MDRPMVIPRSVSDNDLIQFLEELNDGMRDKSVTVQEYSVDRKFDTWISHKMNIEIMATVKHTEK